MNKKLFLILIICSFILESVLCTILIGRIKMTEQDPVLINECLQSVAGNWGDTSSYPELLPYAVLDKDGVVLYQNSENISVTENQAIRHSDIILDLKKGDTTLGKIIFYNKGTAEIAKYKNLLLCSIIGITLLQLVLVLLFYFYTRKTIIKPFEDMSAFAARVAQGNLEAPLELDKKHIFGSFTEAFDLMRSELKKSRAAEKKANDDKKEMVAKLSHDIKTPVASIKSGSELGYELAKDEKTKDRFNQINIKADQITALVDNLFNSSINDIKEIEVKPSTYPSSVVAELLKNADHRNQAGNFSVPDCHIYADKLRLLQAFDNIFMNSYKYGGGTAIAVIAEISGDSLVVDISDKGPGVSDEELPLLKEKYKRGDNVEGKEGAGLGLYLANYYIENMNGRLELYNRHPGFGVKVWLRLDN